MRKFYLLRIFSQLFFLSITISVSGQLNYYVKSSASIIGSGFSWDDPMPLPAALVLAMNNDTIRVAEGTYLPQFTNTYGDTTGAYFNGSFALQPGVTLLGGYPAAAAGTDTSGRTHFTTTVLSGDLNGDDGPDFTNRQDNVIHVVYVNSSSATMPTNVDGFLIKGGNGRYLGPAGVTDPVPIPPDSSVVGGSGPLFLLATYHGLHGNGMLILNNDNSTQSTVIVKHCTVTGNQANQGFNNSQNGHSQARGAGIGVENNLQEGANIHLIITRCQIIANRSVDSLAGSTANDNASSTAGLFILSGATANAGSCILTMDSCNISDNIHIGAGSSTKTRFSSGIRFSSGAGGSSISNTTISGNSIVCSSGGNGYGAGLDLYGSLTMSSSEVINNSITTASGFVVGAGMQLGGAANTYSFQNTTIANNTATATTNAVYGGGIYLYGTGIFQNCTISSNRAVAGTQTFGSALGTNTPNLQMINTTIANNTGGEAFDVENVTAFVLDNTLFANNTNALGAPADILYEGTVNKIFSYSIADGVYYRTSTLDATAVAVSPVLGPLNYNGGFGQTHLLLNDCLNRNPGIGLGDPAFRGIPDQDLINRFQSPWTPAIGAVEYQLAADTAARMGNCGETVQWNTADLFGRPLTYSILDAAVASIDQNGLISLLSEGTTTAQVSNGTDVFCTRVVSVCALPVTWIDFYGKTMGSMNQLTWIVTKEMNVDHYDLERSGNGKDFAAIGKVPAGRSTGTLNLTYQEDDVSPLSGKNYYRVKETDIDGRFSYSKIIVLDNLSSETTLTVYPNPVTDQISVGLSTPQPGGRLSVSLYNLNGKQLWQRQQEVDGNGYTLNEPARDLPSGIYILKAAYEIGSSRLEKTIKLIKN